MKTDNSRHLSLQKILSVLIIAVGIILFMYMIYIEDEPGAVPLLLIALGAGWYLMTRNRVRTQQM